MEALRICYLQLSAFVFIVTGTFAQELVVPSIEVELPYQEGVLTKLREEAKTQAFQKALDASLPMTLEAAKRKEMIQQAQGYVKSYQPLSERREGEVIRFRYRFVFDTALWPVQETSTTHQSLKIEIQWATDQRLSPAKISDFLKTKFQSQQIEVRLARGKTILQFNSPQSKDEVLKGLQVWLGSQGTAQWVDDYKLEFPATETHDASP